MLYIIGYEIGVCMLLFYCILLPDVVKLVYNKLMYTNDSKLITLNMVWERVHVVGLDVEYSGSNTSIEWAACHILQTSKEGMNGATSFVAIPSVSHQKLRRL